MRWWLLTLFFLTALSLGLTLFHHAPQTAGEQLAERLEQQTPVASSEPLREAIQLIDYLPRDADLAEVHAAAVRISEGLVSGGLANAPVRHGADHTAASTADVDVRFFWQSRDIAHALTDPLREAYTESTDPGSPRNRVARALAQAGMYDGTINEALHRAADDLLHLSDEALFEAWLRADRTILVAQTDPPAAAREALLLLARPEHSPVVTFPCDTATVYVIALAPSDPSDIALELSAYRDHALVFTGTLQLRNDHTPPIPPTPETVRHWCVRMAEEALR